MQFFGSMRSWESPKKRKLNHPKSLRSHKEFLLKNCIGFLIFFISKTRFPLYYSPIVRILCINIGLIYLFFHPVSSSVHRYPSTSLLLNFYHSLAFNIHIYNTVYWFNSSIQMWHSSSKIYHMTSKAWHTYNSNF